jgi:hypothetical protein
LRTYGGARENSRDKNPYHADANTRVDVGTTTYGIGRAQHHNSAAEWAREGLPGGLVQNKDFSEVVIKVENEE